MTTWMAQPCSQTPHINHINHMETIPLVATTQILAYDHGQQLAKVAHQAQESHPGSSPWELRLQHHRYKCGQTEQCPQSRENHSSRQRQSLQCQRGVVAHQACTVMGVNRHHRSPGGRWTIIDLPHLQCHEVK